MASFVKSAANKTIPANIGQAIYMKNDCWLRKKSFYFHSTINIAADTRPWIMSIAHHDLSLSVSSLNNIFLIFLHDEKVFLSHRFELKQ